MLVPLGQDQSRRITVFDPRIRMLLSRGVIMLVWANMPPGKLGLSTLITPVGGVFCWSIENHPSGKIIRKINELVRSMRRNEHDVAGFDLMACLAVDECAMSAHHDVIFIPVVWLLKITLPGRIEQSLGRRCFENGRKSRIFRIRPWQIGASLIYRHMP